MCCMFDIVAVYTAVKVSELRVHSAVAETTHGSYAQAHSGLNRTPTMWSTNVCKFAHKHDTQTPETAAPTIRGVQPETQTYPKLNAMRRICTGRFACLLLDFRCVSGTTFVIEFCEFAKAIGAYFRRVFCLCIALVDGAERIDKRLTYQFASCSCDPYNMNKQA